MHLIKTEGTYVESGKLAQIKHYEAEFKLEEDRQSYALGIIQNSGILEKKLRKQIKDFKRARTCGIISMEKLPDDTKKHPDIAPELEKLLTRATDKGCIPANYRSMGDDKSRIDCLEKAIARKEKSIAKAVKRAGKELSNAEK